jgi:ribose transport system substrate-binding protein
MTEKVFRIAILACLTGLFMNLGCVRPRGTIAILPRTTGTPLWETFHLGASEVARLQDSALYWNAPTDESDIEKQLSIFSACEKRRMSGYIIAPDITISFRSPVQRLLEEKIPTVIVNDMLGPEPGPYLSYVLNDESAGAELAAQYVAQLLHGHGSIALMGQVTVREEGGERSIDLERILAKSYPGIQIASRNSDDTVVAHQQNIAQQILHNKVHIDAIIAFSSTSTRGAFYAELAEKSQHVPIVGYDQDLTLPLKNGYVRAVIVQDVRKIGQIAMSNIALELQGKPVAGYTLVPPMLLTRDNLAQYQSRYFADTESYSWGAQ